MKARLPYLAIFVAVAMVYLLGWLQPVERFFIDSRFGIAERNATGDIVVVEIDAASLRELDHWPWPRRYHGQLLDRLINAGARMVALDIDFSSYADPFEDRQLAAALKRASGMVVLTVFKQHATSRSADNETVVNLPNSFLRDLAQLGSVNVYPDGDGLVRRYSVSEMIGGRKYPALPLLLLKEAVDVPTTFLIDYGIRRDTIPRLSYKDILSGRFDPAEIHGKAVIVGASALELGEQLATPLFPVTSGPLFLALAYEGMVQGRALLRLHDGVILAIAALLAFLLGPRLAAAPWRTGAAATLACLLGGYLVSLLIQVRYPVSLETSPWMLTVSAVYLFGLCRQIERHSLEAYRRRAEVRKISAIVSAVIDDVHDGIVICDRRGRISFLNGAAAKMFEVDASLVPGLPVQELLDRLESDELSDSDENTSRVLTRLSDQPLPLEATLPSADEFERTVELIVSRTVLEAGASGSERGKADRIYFNLTFRDITARKSTEHALRKTAAIAIEANEAKSAHLANMSHELRTPLNAIIGFSEMMLRGVFGPLGTEKYIDYTKDIHSSGKHLISLIDDILDLARIESGRQELRPTVINLRDLFDDCVRIICGRAGRLDFFLYCELGNTDWFLFVDRRLLMQAILNLLANSINYADKNVEIRLRARQEENGDLVIEIEDTGWGISEEKLATIANPFEQIVLDKMPRDHGSGLGLSLVTAYAELHGGSFEIESELDEGTIARIRLPSHVIQGSNRRDFRGSGGTTNVASAED